MSIAQSFGRSGFARFVNTPTGRVLRVAAGVALILVGALVVGGGGGTALAVVGLIPLIAGTFDLCWISALLGGPLKGSEVGRS